MEKTTLKAIFGIIICVAVAASLYVTYRNNAMDRLYAQAAGYPQFYKGSSGTIEAIRRLAAYRGQRSANLLLDIAFARGPIVSGDAQSEAIKALGRRNDPTVAISLSHLLQPHQGLATRQATAKALQDLRCPTDCDRSILHYLERIWMGEPNYEDRTTFPPGTESWKSDQQQAQQVLYNDLYKIVQREKLETISILVEVYGLGSDDPSAFALNLVSRVGVREACPYLIQSQSLMGSRRPDIYSAPRSELQASIASLSCK